MSNKKTILLIDDHPLAREGLKSLIARDPSMEVIGEAGNGYQGLQLAMDLRPDLVVMDITLPDSNGIQITRRLRNQLPETHIMIVSMHSKIDYITEALQAGAIGFVCKESANEMLLKGLDVVSRGEYFLDTAISRQVVEKILEVREKDATITDAAYQTLTPREREVLRLIAQELSTKEVAEKLCISPKTVETHRSNIMSKLSLHSTIEVIRYAVKLGLIDVDIWKN